VDIIPPDTFVESFLRAAGERGLAAVVSYGFADDKGKPVLRIKSNRNPEATANLLNWLNRTDERAAMVAGRALHDEGEGEGRGSCTFCKKDVSWHALRDAEQEQHMAAARLILRAASAASRARNLLNDQQPPVS
jgi:hypothetical protein